MADEEVMVSGPNVKPKKRKPPGLSPLQTGLAIGGAASTVMGPAGILIGAGYGLLTKKLQDGWLEKEAAFAERMESEREAFLDQIDRELEMADDDEKRALHHARRLWTDGYHRVMQGDDRGYALLDQANAVSLGIINSDSAARKQDEAAAIGVQRSLVTNAANAYRTEFQQSMEKYQTLTTQADRVFDLVSQPDFDPNKPSNKAILLELVSVGMSAFRDVPDTWDAVSEGSEALAPIPVVGQYAPGIIKAVSTAVKASDFKMGAEDYNRLAVNMKKFVEAQTAIKMQQLSDQATTLDEFARRTNSIPQGYTLRDYISGGVDELQLTPMPDMKQRTPVRITTPTRALQEMSPWNPRNSRVRPTN